jgi:processing peptidase subunit beta
LPNGVRIFTETAPFPGAVNLGLLIETGSRDETLQTSGMMMALKNTYLKSNSRTNE